MKPVLLRIPFSHYCRKVEWGLSQACIAYDTLDVKLWQMHNARRANPLEGTVPVLRMGDRIILGSHKIMVWADEHRAPGALPLYPDRLKVQVATWESWADEHIGPPTRREAYRALHADPRRARGYDTVPFYFRLPPARRLYLAVLKAYRARRFEASDPTDLKAIFAKVADQLLKSGTGYLFTDHPTAADYATAALLEPLVPIADEHGYSADAAWPDVAEFIARVRPGAVSRAKSRSVKESDWLEFERLHGKAIG